jgi:hypothetical protein
MEVYNGGSVGGDMEEDKNLVLLAIDGNRNGFGVVDDKKLVINRAGWG